MRYLILKWDGDALRWDVVFYAHTYKAYKQMRDTYPPTNICVHMVDLKYLDAHAVMLEVQEMGGI